MIDLPDNVVHVGFTGTREQLPQPQADALFNLLRDLRERGARYVHHGMCPFGGADAFIHLIAVGLGMNVIMHPMLLTSPSQRQAAESMVAVYGQGVPPLVRTLKPKPSADRNNDIAFESEFLGAAPLYPENHPQSRRSGTWQTVRSARHWSTPVAIFDADGNPSL